MTRLLLTLAAVAVLTGCSGQIDLSCDKPRLYQQATEPQRVKAPEGFDELDLSREMPVPSAAPAKPRPAGQPCLDIPPRYLDGTDLDPDKKDEDPA